MSTQDQNSTTDTERKGDWMFTFTGRHFWPLDPRPEDVDIRDIAHHLALVNRFGGASLRPYSVAQHSVLVASIVEPDHRLWALLHDAPEAYLGDVVRPLKRQPQFAFYREAEEAIMACVCLRFGMPYEMPDGLKHADNVALFTEARDLSRKPEECRTWYKPVEPLPQTIVPWDWAYAETRFLETFEEITKSSVRPVPSSNPAALRPQWSTPAMSRPMRTAPRKGGGAR